MLLSELVDRLAAEVPAEDGVPSEEQYERAIKDAILDFSERCGLIRSATISVVPNTATYELPADFLSLISTPALYSPFPDSVIHTIDGLIPIPTTYRYQEEVYTSGLNIVFTPTPTYQITRVIRYKAAWVSTVEDYDEDYESLGEREARIVLLKAESIAMNKLSNSQAGSAIKYSFGAVSEDLTGGSESTKATADLKDSEYLEACKTYNGAYASYGY